jgi:hypothetical protein
MKRTRGIVLVVALFAAWGVAEPGDVVVDGLLVSNGGGVKFADGSEQSSAAHPRWQRIAYVDPHGDGDYTDPAAAMADLGTWCPGPSTLTPCLVKVLPGDYDVGSAPVVMHEGVDLEGSGRNTTFIRGTVPGISTGLVVLSTFSEVRSLTLINNGTGAANAVGIYSSSADPFVDDVLVYVSGASDANIGIHSLAGIPTIRATYVQVVGGTSCYGILTSDAAPLLDEVEVWTDGPGGSQNIGISMSGSAAPRLRQVRVQADGGDQVTGIFMDVIFATVEGSRVKAQSTGTATVQGIVSNGGTHRLTDCRVEAWGGATATGIMVENNSGAIVMGGEVDARDGSSFTHGILIDGSAPLVQSTRISASGGQFAFGIRNRNSAAADLRQVTATGENGSTYTYGVINDDGATLEAIDLVARASNVSGTYGVLNTNVGGDVFLDRCTVEGGNTSVRNDNSSAQFGVGNSKLIGPVTANLTCFGNHDGSYAAVSCP